MCRKQTRWTTICTTARATMVGTSQPADSVPGTITG